MPESSSRNLGSWKQVAFVSNGERSAFHPNALLTVSEQEYSVSVNGKVIQRGRSVSDTSVSPCQSDVTVTEGVDIGQKYAQIFQVHGDVLLVCRGQAGAQRPSEFKSDPGSGTQLSLWLRVSNEEAQLQTLTPGNVWVWTVFLVALGMSDAVRKDLDQSLGYWPGLLVTIAISSALAMLAAMVFKWGWQRGLALGVAMSSAFHTFEELKTVLGPTLGYLGAILVATCTAVVLGMVLTHTVSRVLKVRWN